MEIGDKLSGRYLLTDFIGQGGMANVYLARDLILDRNVAVKVLRFDFQDNKDAIRRFQREAVSASQLLHRNIVEIYDVEEKEEQQYIVMEYVQGTDLKTYIRENAPLSLEMAVRIMSQILSAIEVAHKNQIIHRDIKPQNILITRTKEVKITDFGIAVALSDTSITQTNTLLGSVHYLSPEQARGGNATVKSDIYALGVVLYELITGSVPFDGESAVSVALKHFQEDFPRIKEKIDYVPQSLENIVLKATAKNPENRYESVHSMLADLTTALNATRMNEAMWVPHDAPTTELKAIKPTKGHKPSKKALPAPEPIDYSEYQSFDPVKPLNKAKRGRKFLVWLLSFLSLTVIALGTYYAYLQLTQFTTIPDISQLEQTEAMQILQEADIHVGQIQKIWDNVVEQGKVIEANPKAGTKVRRGSSIDLTISNGKEQVEIGDYVGQDYEHIRAQLTAAGFIVQRRDFAADEADNGKILAQSLEPGSKVVASKTSLVLTVGKVADQVRMQDFFNLPISIVNEFAEANGLIVEVEYAYSNDIPADRVIEQQPENGTQLQPGDTIAVTVSQGPKEETIVKTSRRVEVDYVPRYAPSDVNQKKPLPNKIQVFIGDSKNNINTVARTLEITQYEIIDISFYLEENSIGQFRIMRDGEVVAESNEVYPYE